MTEHDARKQLETRFGPGPHWVIADSSDRCIGVARLAPISEGDNSARFAIGILDPNRLGEGLGTETTSLIIRYGFDRLRLARIDLTVLADNSRTTHHAIWAATRIWSCDRTRPVCRIRAR